MKQKIAFVLSTVAFATFAAIIVCTISASLKSGDAIERGKQNAQRIVLNGLSTEASRVATIIFNNTSSCQKPNEFRLTFFSDAGYAKLENLSETYHVQCYDKQITLLQASQPDMLHQLLQARGITSKP